MRDLQPDTLIVSLGPLTIQGLTASYTHGEERGYVALINSWGLLEISSFKGSAHLRCGAKIGDKVYIEGQEIQGETQ